MTISREKRSQKTFCFLLTIVKRRVTNKPAIGRGKEREKVLSLPLTSLWPRFRILPRWLFFFFFLFAWSARDNRGDFYLVWTFGCNFAGIFFFFGEQSAESWNKSFSRGWKIYTKSFWPGCFKGCSNFSNSYFHSCPSFIFYSILLRIHQMEFRSFVHHLCESSGSDRLRWNSRDFVLVI